MRYVILFLMTLIFIGCSHGGGTLKLAPYTKLSSPSISIQTPNSFPKKPWKAWSITGKGAIQLWRQLPNLGENIRITAYIPDERINIDDLLNKKDSDDLENNLKKPPSEWAKNNMKERGVTYNKNYVDYIDGLKCTTNVEASTIALNVAAKQYYTVCGYYDNQGNKKRLDISYRYAFTYGMTSFEAQEEMKEGKVFPTPQAMQVQFKKDITAIFTSLKIHDMDRVRMKKQGLLHNRKYEIPRW